MLSLGNWNGVQRLGHPREYECGHCGNEVGTDQGYSYSTGQDNAIAICPRCAKPTYCEGKPGNDIRFPGSPPGEPVTHVPADLAQLYEEARQSAGAGAYTACVMVCRKMLMNIAVKENAKEGLKFIEYIKYLEDNHYFSPKSKDFVTYIKDLGNEANHEIAPKSQADALAALEFVRALLSHNYELPSKVPPKPSATTSTT